MENEEKKIAKGIDLAAKETKQNLTYTLNKSGLPPVVIKYILNDLLLEVEKIEEVAINDQRDKYMEQLKREQKKEEPENDNTDD